LLAHDDGQPVDELSAQDTNVTKKAKPRRRARLRTDGLADQSEDMQAAVFLAADPNRFAGLDEKWFWLDEFHIPDRPTSWPVRNSEVVFKRRQEAKRSYSKLAVEFKVSTGTIRAAILHYLDTHSDVKDNVDLPRGGQRKRKFDVALFSAEARQLWEAGWPKEELAAKFGCSPPVIDKALAFEYEKEGSHLPTRHDRQNAKATQARRLFDEGGSLEAISRVMKVSDVSARRYLQASFAAENKKMPDLRKLGKKY
jgi:hypothetical protein